MLEGMETGFESIWYTEGDVTSLRSELEVANTMAEYFREAYSDSSRALLNAEDIGWVKLGISNTDITQISLQEAKQVSRRLHGYAESNPLLTRGREIRNSYLFSGNYVIGVEDAEGKISTQMWNIIHSRKNQDNVFSMAALEKLEGERYSAGQVFVLYDRTEKTFQQISFQEIGDIIYDPNDAAEIRYVKREWTAVVIGADGGIAQRDFAEYYPSSRYDRPSGGYPATIAGIPVRADKRMIVDRVNMQAGGNLGIPDSFAAAPWALAYSAYLSDGSKVLAALAEWAWLVKPKKRNPAETAAATVRSERGAGGTLFTDMDVQALPTSNAIDLTTGRPLASNAASGLGVSVVLLLADPGQAGTNASAQTLSDPNRRTMEARRQKNTDFLIHCLELIGVKSPTIQWPKMSPGTDVDEMNLLMQIWGSGLFHVDEVRPRMASVAHVTVRHEDPPEGFIQPNNHEAAKEAASNEPENPSPVHADGSTEMSNGQGRDSQGIGNLSHARKANSERGTASARANT